MRVSSPDGFGAAALACIATTMVVVAEHLPKVIKRQVYYGSESSCQESNLSPDLEHDSRLPQHEFDSEFCSTEKYQKLSCVHGHTPARRVCMEGFYIGRRFLSCPLEGYEACAFVNWLDEERHGRARSVITKFIEDNVKLKKKLADLECTFSTMKQERINHKQQMKARDKKELACVVVVVTLAMFYALFAIMIGGFV
ncbi:hypothetical protein CFC21_092847 [Triticum aestivum]|uniref:GRF-type domain-containing protein n=2 Tax=Triticum aestivum TaxID=4565 RepID=A0A9R1IJ00_WHEAT|nr:hypothetical protein CFC21_088170 [Triticum aestivum]KAF7090017.1 hypothetical protein CFC21_092847 [Triticum aestivum]